ncbi:acyl carrier protein [Aliarcobacter cryaerophilus]|uniref:acyl carrier protein n=1 Tax=Aliarcobacter TaxID=2321111 RepID=UPI00164B8BBF|nr:MULTISPECIES: acyl carrier protein [Aliarcobacter]MDX4026213.1 acyl carrier protein [Aliarcobacter skirrowii]QNK85142.1 acyl carrier protein [Aliarcobacter cryaerophilus]
MEKIREILIDIRPEYDFLEEVNFIEAGMLDSFDVINLVNEIEEQFKIQIDGSNILPENFSSIISIRNLIILSGGKI